jgi:hypothetical protein
MTNMTKADYVFVHWRETSAEGNLTDEGRVAMVLAALHSFAEDFFDAPNSEGRARLMQMLVLLMDD